MESMDKIGPLKDCRDGETDTGGTPPVDDSMDECFQSLMTKNPNQRITIHDPCIIKTGKADLPAKRDNTMEIIALSGKCIKETSPKEESLKVKGLKQFCQGQSGHTDFLEYMYTHMESKSFTELQHSKTDSEELVKVQQTYVEPNPTSMKPLGLIEPEGARMEPLDLSLKKTKNKLQNGCSITKLLPEEKELTLSRSSSVKVAAIPEFPPSNLPKRRQLSRSQPYWIPLRINKNVTLYGIFQPKFIVNTEEVNGNSSQEMSRRDEDDEKGIIRDTLKGDHIDRPPPVVTSSSAHSSVSGQLTIPEMELNSSEYICLKLDPQSRNHDEPLNEMGSAVAEDKATVNTRHSYIPLLEEIQGNVDTWCTPSTTQSVKHKLRYKLANKQCNGGTKPFI